MESIELTTDSTRQNAYSSTGVVASGLASWNTHRYGNYVGGICQGVARCPVDCHTSSEDRRMLRWSYTFRKLDFLPRNRDLLVVRPSIDIVVGARRFRAGH